MTESYGCWGEQSRSLAEPDEQEGLWNAGRVDGRWKMKLKLKKKKTSSNTIGSVVGDRMGYYIRQMDLWLFMVACKG